MNSSRKNLVTHEQTDGQTDQYDLMRFLAEVGSNKPSTQHHAEDFWQSLQHFCFFN